MWASLLDTVLLVLISMPLLWSIGGWQLVLVEEESLIKDIILYLMPVVLVLLFWSAKQATPGKILIRAKIVDADSGLAPTFSKLCIRYIGYLVSMIPLGLGYFWVAFDPKKQGWHDKLAGTVVIRYNRANSIS